MRVVAYGVTSTEKEPLALANHKKHEITLIANYLGPETVFYAEGKDAVVVFTEDVVSASVVNRLADAGVKFIATCSTGSSHIDQSAAAERSIRVANVPKAALNGVSLTELPIAMAREIINNLDRWEEKKCLGEACVCSRACDRVKNKEKHEHKQLSAKYRVAAPRYTSYPTVPFWDSEGFTEQCWSAQLLQSNKLAAGISLYIHLPFCESLCTYCGCNTRITKNHSVEGPYITAVLKEWQLYLNQLPTRPLIKEIHLGGGTPTFFSPRNLELLIAGIIALASVHPEAELSIEGHPNNTTTEHLEILYRLGFRRLSLGIQDFDPTVQFIINRIQTVESVAKVTAEARRIGYHSVNYDLIYGLPLQKLDGLIRTLGIVTSLLPDRIAFYSYAHVPWVKPGQRRYTEAHLPSAELKAELYDKGREMLIEAGYAEIGMDHFTLTTDSMYRANLRGQLHRNFMGYTEQSSRILIGLGVSAISDCWAAFAQNVKTVEEYLKIVNRGQLPVFKGHFLNRSDLVIRQHILNIMCRGYTSWLQLEMQDEVFSEGHKRLQELADDGLITLTDSDLTVTAIGKRFLRNICMAIDARLWRSKPETQLFSLAD